MRRPTGYRSANEPDLDRLFDRYDSDEIQGRGGDDEGVRVSNVEVIRVTDAALLCRGKGLGSDPFGLEDEHEEVWIPRSQVHPSSEIAFDAEVGASGDLVVTTWIAERKSIKPSR